MYHYKECGLNEIYLKNGYKVIKTGYGESVGIHDAEGLHKTIGEGLLKKSGLLTGREFRFLRIELDLSQKALGLLMDKSDQAIAGWEKGERDIPVLADAAMKNLYSEKVNETPIAGLLEEMAAIDRECCELTIQLEETDLGWQYSDSPKCA